MKMTVLDDRSRAELGGCFIELSGGWTHYELSGPGNGPPLILVHGNAAPMVSWDRNIRAFRNAGFRILRYDIFGHGFSDRPQLDVYNKSLYDTQLSELIEKLGIEKPFYLAGTSQGGSIAACYAATHPGAVSKLALLSPLFDEYSGKFIINLLKSRFGDFLMAKAGAKTVCDPARGFVSDVFTAELAEKVKAQLKFEGKPRAVLANLRGDSIEHLELYYKDVANQGIPVFLSWGEHDASIPRRSIRRLREILPDADYHFIDRAAHLAHYEFSDILNPLMTDFFCN